MGLTQLLKGHNKDLGGGMLVKRLLPAAMQRSVGPFVFFDHFGPATVHPQDKHDVRPHPHIGLATITYLFEGAMLHRDSLGYEQLIEPGAINLMSAGKGIVHSERRPALLRDQTYVNHGLQLWLALPVALEESEPSFHHTPASALPEWQGDGVKLRVLMGQAMGLISPVPTFSPTLYLDLALNAGASWIWHEPAQELAVYALDAPVLVQGERVEPGQMAVLDISEPLRIEGAAQAARLALIGGQALEVPRQMWWNFVSSRKERIVQAAQDWQAQRMGQIAGEHEWIELPQPGPKA
jgi:redox-sensitive bicupin YhaK (pirin superfamily)